MSPLNNMELYKYVLSVRGMRCGECESHINDVIRKNFIVKKVKANRHKRIVEIYSLNPLDEDSLKETIEKTGYSCLGIVDRQIVRKRFLL